MASFEEQSLYLCWPVASVTIKHEARVKLEGTRGSAAAGLCPEFVARLQLAEAGVFSMTCLSTSHTTRLLNTIERQISSWASSKAFVALNSNSGKSPPKKIAWAPQSPIQPNRSQTHPYITRITASDVASPYNHLPRSHHPLLTFLSPSSAIYVCSKLTGANVPLPGHLSSARRPPS